MPFPSNVAGGQTILASWGNNVVESLPQIGSMNMYAGDTAPPNWLLCRGQAVSRATYSVLFGIVGIRFGPGDGTSTFNLPDMRGRYPIGFNQGGSYFSVGVGEKFGTKDSILPAHQHGGINHLHAFSATSAGATARHNHNMNHGEVYRYNPFAPIGYNAGGSVSDGSPFDIFNTNVNTGIDQQDHAHVVSGTTAGADRNLNTGWAGVDATNGNLPPSLSVNYICRAL